MHHVVQWIPAADLPSADAVRQLVEPPKAAEGGDAAPAEPDGDVVD